MTRLSGGYYYDPILQNKNKTKKHWGLHCKGASQVTLGVKNPPANAGDIKNVGSVPGSGRSPGGGHGNTLHYSCLDNSMDRGAWRATAHGLAKSHTGLKWLTMHACTHRVPYCSASRPSPVWRTNLKIFQSIVDHCFHKMQKQNRIPHKSQKKTVKDKSKSSYFYLM